ncbi:response regulator [bacterium]|nr:response regulator [bacterium]
MSADAAMPARILVVDDHRTNRLILTQMLHKQGYEVEDATNGREALDKIRSISFDMVLLDVVMPEMDGYRVLETLKQDPQLRFLPVIMISSIGEIESVVKCIGMGAEDYLQKPFNKVLLNARVSASLEKKGGVTRNRSISSRSTGNVSGQMSCCMSYCRRESFRN